MRLEKNILYAIFTSLTLTCFTTEPELEEFHVKVRNNVEADVEVEFFYLNEPVSAPVVLKTNEEGLKCSYQDENFTGYKLTACQIDSMIFRFNNGKGFISSINSSSRYDFTDNQNPFGPGQRFENISDKEYVFVLTQEDFENAFELPD